MKKIFATFLIFNIFLFVPNTLAAPKIKVTETYDEFDGVGIRKFDVLSCAYLPLKSISAYFRTSNEYPFIYLTFLSYEEFQYHETIEIRFKDDPDKEVFTISTKDYDTDYYGPINQYSSVRKYYTTLTYYDSNMVFEKIVNKYSQLASGQKNKKKIEMIYRSKSRDNTILYSGNGGCNMRADRAKVLKETYDSSLKFMQAAS